MGVFNEEAPKVGRLCCYQKQHRLQFGWPSEDFGSATETIRGYQKEEKGYVGSQYRCLRLRTNMPRRQVVSLQ